MTFVLALFLLGQAGPVKTIVPDNAKTVAPAPGVDTGSANAGSAETLDVIRYGGKRVRYDAEQSLVYLRDSAWVAYQDLELKSDSIVYDIKQHLLSSYRRSFFRTESDTVIGKELHYSLDSRKGYITDAQTAVDNGFYTGHTLWIVREKTLDVNDATFTTCDRRPPHYTFGGSRVRVYTDDMVVCEPLILRIGKVPVIAAPFWFFPISKHRKSGLMPLKVGRSDLEGFYAKDVSWFWAINDYSDATIALDVMTRKGFKWAGEGNYIVGPYATGSILGSYIRENDTKSTRYSIAANHTSRFFFGSRLDARADFQSDASFVSDYAETPTLWLKNELNSFASIGRTFPNLGTLNITASRDVQLQQHHTETDLPTIGLSLVSLPLGGGWAINSGLSAANHETRQDSLSGDSTRVVATGIVRTLGLAPNLSLSLPSSFLGGLTLPLGFNYSELTRVRHDSTGDTVLSRTRSASTGTGFSFSQNALGFLNLSEGISYNEAVGLFPESTHTDATYHLSGTGSFSLYKVFGLELLGLHGMLHKATPSIAYGYTPRSHSRGLYGTPRFDTLPQASSITLGLANDFQVKVGEAKTKRSLGDVNFGSGYDFLTRKFGSVSGNADVYFLDQGQAKLSTTGGTTFDPYGRQFTNFNLSTNLFYGLTVEDSTAEGKVPRHFGVTLQHFLSVDPTRSANGQHMLTGELQLEPRGWAFKLTGGWNIKDHLLTNYTLDLVKDLHCWEFAATVTRFNDPVHPHFTYDFKLRIKSIPDVALGKNLFGWALPNEF